MIELLTVEPLNGGHFVGMGLLSFLRRLSLSRRFTHNIGAQILSAVRSWEASATLRLLGIATMAISISNTDSVHCREVVRFGLLSDVRLHYDMHLSCRLHRGGESTCE